MSSRLADEAFRKGDWSTAERLSDGVLASAPGDPLALKVKGMTLARTGRAEEAIRFLERALKSQPDDFVLLEWLHGTSMQAGRFAQAAAFAERARAVRPHDVTILMGLSQACLKIGEPARAVQCLESARSKAPLNPVVRHLLGQAYERSKRNREALAEYREAIRIDRKLGDAYDRACRILVEEGKFGAALRLCEQAFAAIPERGSVHLQAAKALSGLERPDEAVSHARTAVALDPGLAWAAANWLQSIGASDDALAVLTKSIEQEPCQGRAYYGLVKSRKIGPDDRGLVDRLIALRESGSLPPKERVALLRALGKASDDLGNYEAATRYFDEAAELGIKAFGAEGHFDSRPLDAARESFLGMFDSTFVGRHWDLGRVGSAPIFVIGMIRSGTTLVQRILASHPSVGDAGEQPFWTTAFPALVDLDAGCLRRDVFAEARDRYLEILSRFAPRARVVANKWPMNYAHAGLLLIAYPDARIVHVERDPLDTALSIYMTDLGEPPPEFSYRRADIVSVYRDYRKRMRHWDEVLPPGSILTVRYEDLVANHEPWTRMLLEFCGLEWDERCLRFHEATGRVDTPSMLQVRHPIYSTSIGKWRRYEPWLGELDQLRDRG